VIDPKSLPQTEMVEYLRGFPLDALSEACLLIEPGMKRAIESRMLVLMDKSVATGRVTNYDKDFNVLGYRDFSPTDFQRMAQALEKFKLTAAIESVGTADDQVLSALRKSGRQARSELPDPADGLGDRG